MSTVYVASSYFDRAVARQAMVDIALAGHEITLDWTTCNVPSQEQAEREYSAVSNADVFVGILPGRLGFHVELGIALRGHCQIILIGQRDAYVCEPEKCLFYRMPEIEWADDLAGVLALLAVR